MVDKAWRDGDFLAMHVAKAVLPQRCVSCGASAAGSLTNMHIRERIPLLYYLLSGPFAFVFVPRAKLKLPLCEHHRQREQLFQHIFLGMLLTWLVAVGVFAGLGVMADLKDPMPAWTNGLLIVATCVWVPLLPIMLIFVWGRPRLVRAKRIEKPFVWLEGVDPGFLADCPELPGTLDDATSRLITSDRIR